MGKFAIPENIRDLLFSMSLFQLSSIEENVFIIINLD